MLGGERSDAPVSGASPSAPAPGTRYIFVKRALAELRSASFLSLSGQRPLPKNLAMPTSAHRTKTFRDDNDRRRHRWGIGAAAIVYCLVSSGGARGAETGKAGAAAPRSNGLFIAVDDMRCELGCYGAKHVRSPNIHRSVESGVVFTRA